MISPMRYVSMRTPASSIAARTTRERKLDVAVQPLGAALGRPSRGAARPGAAPPRRAGRARPSPPRRADRARARRRTRPSRSSSSYSARPGSIRYASEHRVVRGRLSERAAPSRRARRRRAPRSAGCGAGARCTTITSPSSVATAMRSRVGGDADAAADAREIAFAPGHLLRLGLGTLRRRQRLVERVDAAEQRRGTRTAGRSP